LSHVEQPVLRVLILTRNFPPRACGVGDYAFRMAAAMAAAGDFVAVLTEPVDTPRHVAIGLREHSLGGWSDLQPVLGQILQAAPDFVQLEYSGYAWGRWGVAWWLNALLFKLRRQGIPVHIGLHETAIRMRQHPLQIAVALAQWAHVGLLLAAAETVALNMPSRVKTLGRIFPWWRSKLRYRPNASNIPVEFITQAERTTLRRKLGVEDGETVVATFGMFHTAKHYEALVGAIPLLPEKPVRLWMLGDVAMASPEYVAQLKAMARVCGIEGRVWWPGRLDAGQVSRMLQSADLFVLPQPDGHLTRSGSFMAAAAHGLPVVAVRDHTQRDQLEFTHGKNIWLVERSAPQEFAAAIDALMSDPAAASRMGSELRRLYDASFDWRLAAVHFSAVAAAAVGMPVSTTEENRVSAAHAGGAKP
jgi:glycosyltransferase involved in cell wall biosynthesis